MTSKKSGIARSIVVVAIILIIAVAGAGAYFLTSTGGSTRSSTSLATSSQTSSLSSSISTTSSASASSQSSTSTYSTSLSTSTSLTCPTTSTTISSSTSTTTTTSMTGTPAYLHQLVEMFGNFSAMKVNSYGYSHNSTTGATYQYNGTSSYRVLYSPKTGASAYKVNFTESIYNPSEAGMMWIQPDGMIIAIYMSGHNSTGAVALGEAGLLTAPFPVVFQYGIALQAYLSFPGMHQINQTSLTLGPTTLTVTNYGISSPTSFCNGSGVITNSRFLLQVGKVSGTTMTLVPLWSEAGAFYPATGGSLTYSSTLRITSVTKA
ncbi:MAG: hypothetical protein OK438_01295 [Thaumarchaeota archaeon]|nr:hypothetical protein [Nitrososphaerota archaeon]